MIDRKLLRNIDVPLIIAAILIIAFGLTAISSATHVTDSKLDSSFSFVERQITFAIIGLGLVYFVLNFHYEELAKYSKYLYVINILLLGAVLVMGQVTNGANSWIPIGPFKLQPSEFSKVITIICFADYLTKRQGKLNSIKEIILAFMYVGVPMAIIMKQPDLGTTLVFIAISFGMLFIAGGNWKFLLTLVLSGLIAIFTMYYLYDQHKMSFILEDYQWARLTSFVDPSKDPKDTGYHLIQSEVAIGSGGLYGKGLYQGTQNQLNFLPEQHTDFIFSVVGEELGFAGVSTALLLLFFLVYRSIKIASQAKDMFGTLIAVGIVSMLVFHILENAGMTVGLMPITGIPLPFFSYGGSSLWTNMIALGLLLNIGMRRQKLIF
jgi:rod shape determining protein RodA